MEIREQVLHLLDLKVESNCGEAMLCIWAVLHLLDFMAESNIGSGSCFTPTGFEG
jgi:hypothetical protein